MPVSSAATDAIAVRTSPIHGLGVFALRAITEGEVIAFYEGRRMAPDEVEQGDWNNALTYVFGLSDGSVIDGAQGGNATRHLNHSCSPNCIAYEVVGEDGLLHIQFEALRDIDADEELSLDYQLIVDMADESAYDCSCSSLTCRGSMRAPAPAPAQRGSRRRSAHR